MSKHVTNTQLQDVMQDHATRADQRFLKNADKGALATKDNVAESDLANELSTKLNGKADQSTTLAGYHIGDAYTKEETDNKIAESQASLNKPGGSLTAAQIVSGLLIKGNLGKVYNVTEDFDTTADFVEGAGKHLPAGTNIQVIDADTTGETPSYKFDIFAGAYGTATQSGNGLMSSTDKTKLDNADVTPYTNGNGINVTNHEVSAAVDGTNGMTVGASGIGIELASSSKGGAMSSTDKVKLDGIEEATSADIQAIKDSYWQS